MITVRKCKVIEYSGYRSGQEAMFTDRLARALIEQGKVEPIGWDPNEPTPETPVMDRAIHTGSRLEAPRGRLSGRATVIK